MATVLSKFISFFYLTPLKTQSTKKGDQNPIRPPPITYYRGLLLSGGNE